MVDDELLTDPGFLGITAGSVVSIVLGLMILLWPGPIAPTDRIPFALLFLIPGVIGASSVRRRLARSA